MDHRGAFYAAVRSRVGRTPRWSDLDTGLFGYRPFGGRALDERTFEGVTLPARLRVGWLFGTTRFEAEGEFFRCTLRDATYR